MPRDTYWEKEDADGNVVVYSAEEVASFCTATVTDDITNEDEMRDALDGWAEHMRAGEYPTGRSVPATTPKIEAAE